MSLISEALKKAQRDRMNAPHAQGHKPQKRVVVSSSPPNPKLFWGLLIGGTFIGMLFILLLVVLLKPQDGATDLEKTSQGGLGKPTKAIERSAFGEVTIVKAGDEIEAPVPEIITGAAIADSIKEQTDHLFAQDRESSAVLKKSPAPTPGRELVLPEKDTSVSPLNKGMEATKTESAIIEVREAQEQKIEDYIEALDISGLKIAGENSKVLLNNRVYSIGSYIGYQLPVKIVEITPKELVFIDESGTEYRREL
ncbi:MAG: hypothetical protein COZ46_05910 [Verrucomicrobia bacterium CG_4_10_14_3_um_filter_43_23]|nr:MAG: hypothetical protein AUJ82_02570 [Verrucomicrobia bacterium CG1_02_43_26]PIP59148.1 MAG: hypothetical protein COX01_04975 [Verrucomicrobia bacterium CG22_combo_CG10-13_8_21_14_all_43_17]PIX58041.1 MAG: hypothetical protein COZ46_05910 [Verrucomicrobia bacterium CG_4_10_14_3_um_filter_43_23]PIY62276.1 MAG: hypothetical protein COY94_02480 [Verrucomicrobia bacterium CG_4_10_14_0_8_um_filter_43_34]PJA43754.1 MAG: hypothetical protein CO175_06460 [Verrucomicrobia bacterium CG_4_9_14_3_um_fi